LLEKLLEKGSKASSYKANIKALQTILNAFLSYIIALKRGIHFMQAIFYFLIKPSPEENCEKKE